MFSIEEKKLIAEAVEKVLLALKHPEMPAENASFRLEVFGKEAWSFANIEPNWRFKETPPSVNEWNEVARDVLG